MFQRYEVVLSVSTEFSLTRPFPMWVRGIEAAIFVTSAVAFVYCLYPRRGRRATQT